MEFENTGPTTVKVLDTTNPLPVVFSRAAEVLTADRTLTSADDNRVFVANAVDLTLTLHTPTAGDAGFSLSVIVAAVSATTGFTVSGAINGGATSAVNTAATDAQGDRLDLVWTGTAWIGTVVQGTWSVT